VNIRRGRCIVLAAVPFVWMATPSVLVGQSKTSRAATPAKYVFLLPNGFRGWVCVDFGVAGAAPLPRDQDAVVVRPHQGEVLATSDKANTYTFYGEAWFDVDGRRKPLPIGVTVHPGPSRTGRAESTERRCIFIGTIDERDAAEEPPGFQNLLARNAALPTDERQVLESLYNATDGEHWKHRVGWLGPPGTECNWHGVVCQQNGDEQMRVSGLELYENNLNGRIPDELTSLSHLESLVVSGNHLAGRLPDVIIQRWLAGSLWISAEAPLLTDVSAIDFESYPSALLCGQRRILLHADTSAISYVNQCRNATPADRTTYCEVKEGKIWWEEFARLAWLLEKDGFFALKPNYERNVTHGTFVSTRVIRFGQFHEVVDYAGGGPLSLWAIHRSIEGVGSSANWEKTRMQPTCPRWTQSKNPQK